MRDIILSYLLLGRLHIYYMYVKKYEIGKFSYCPHKNKLDPCHIDPRNIQVVMPSSLPQCTPIDFSKMFPVCYVINLIYMRMVTIDSVKCRFRSMKTPIAYLVLSVTFAIIIIIMAGMAVFNVAGYLIEERRRRPVTTASPRGQCSK